MEVVDGGVILRPSEFDEIFEDAFVVLTDISGETGDGCDVQACTRDAGHIISMNNLTGNSVFLGVGRQQRRRWCLRQGGVLGIQVLM